MGALIALIVAVGACALVYVLHRYPPEFRLRHDTYTFDGNKSEAMRFTLDQAEKSRPAKKNVPLD